MVSHFCTRGRTARNDLSLIPGVLGVGIVLSAMTLSEPEAATDAGSSLRTELG